MTYRENGFVMEAGPDSLLARKTAGPQLIRELGVESEMVGTNPAVGKTYVLSGGKLVPLPSGTNMGVPVMLESFLKSKLISTSGKMRALFDLVLPKRINTKDEPLGKFLRHRLGNEVVELLCEPLLAGIYAGSIDDLGVQATFPEFQKLTNSDRSLILGSMRMFRNRPKPASSGNRSLFVSLKSGLQTLPERLVELLHETTDLRLESEATNLSRREDGTYDVQCFQNGQSETLHADAVIIAAPAPVAGNLLNTFISSASLLKKISYVSTATVIMGYPRQSFHANLDASGFVVPRRENRAITASTWLSTKWPHTTKDDYVMIRCYVGRAKQEAYLNLSNGDMSQRVQEELKNVLGITTSPAFTKITRWDAAMPQYQVNHLDNVRRVEQELLDRTPGVHIAGAGYRGIGIPDCIVQGQQAATQVLKHIGITD